MGGFLGIPVDLTHNYQATNTAIIKSSLDVVFVQILQAGSLFVMIKYVHEASSGIYSKVRCILEYDLLNRFITSISKASYGMYHEQHLQTGFNNTDCRFSFIQGPWNTPMDIDSHFSIHCKLADSLSHQ